MSNQQNNSGGSAVGGILFLIAVVLMVVGFAMESSDYNAELGALLFTIGFWLMMIPLIIFGIIMLIMLAAALATR